MKSTSRTPSWLALSLGCSLLLPVPQVQGTSEPGTSAVQARSAAGPATWTRRALDGNGERCEHFLIEWDSTAPHPGIGYEGDLQLADAVHAGEVGLVEVRRRLLEGEWQLELDVHFPFEGVRLMAVERLGEKHTGLIWREVIEAGGRTLFAEWNRGGSELQVREWSSTGSHRRGLRPTGPTHMPLALLEAARFNELPAGSLEVFDPMLSQVQPWDVEHSTVAGDLPGESWRQVEFRRRDGSLAGRYHFEGEQLVGFRWQEGGLRMTRLPAEEHRARRILWGIEDR